MFQTQINLTIPQTPNYNSFTNYSLLLNTDYYFFLDFIANILIRSISCLKLTYHKNNMTGSKPKYYNISIITITVTVIISLTYSYINKTFFTSTFCLYKYKVLKL